MSGGSVTGLAQPSQLGVSHCPWAWVLVSQLELCCQHLGGFSPGLGLRLEAAWRRTALILSGWSETRGGQRHRDLRSHGRGSQPGHLRRAMAGAPGGIRVQDKKVCSPAVAPRQG